MEAEKVEAAEVKDHTMKEITDSYPGKMAVADVRGTYSGSQLVSFFGRTPHDMATTINEFFKENLGLLVVDTKYVVGPEGYIAYYIVTAQQTAEYVAKLGELQARIQQAMAEEKVKELEAEERAEEARIAAEKEAKRLQALGRTCEEHHRPVIDENKALKAEVKKLKKGKG